MSWDADDPANTEAAWRMSERALDPDSGRGWRRRAVGMPREQALSEIPRVGVLQTQLPIEPLRAIQRHIRARRTDQAKWVREAIVAYYLATGGDPEVGRAALEMQRTLRSREVSRDQLGQDRRRVGRKGRG